MKLTILKEKLKEGVGVVERISQRSLTLPILQNILLKAEKNFLQISSTNLESGINWHGLAKVEKEGKICVPTRFFSNLLGFLPEKPVTLEVKDSFLNLKCENQTTKIKGLSAEDFPTIPQPSGEIIIDVNSSVFCKSLGQIAGIPSSSSTRPEISGIFLVFSKGVIKAVATDSFRLAEKKIFIKNKNLKDYSLILPQAASKEIIGIFGEKEGGLKIYLSPNQVMFEYKTDEFTRPQIQFTSRIIDGEYPDYEEIIPKKYETEIKVGKKELLNQIKAASLFSGKINEVKLSIDPKRGKIDVFSQSPDVGEYKGVLRANIKGKNILISFNHRFLIDGISEMREKDVIFQLTNEEGPACLRPLTKEQDFLYIIMPIKAT